jgi:type II secretory pathway pseudopilin PulG
MTLMELVVVLAVAGILSAVAVPGVVAVQRTFRAHDAGRRLALVLRTAQARAQVSGVPVKVTVEAGGGYVVVGVGTPERVVARGDLGAAVSGNYPDGTVQFGASGLPSVAGGTSPRAGHFTVADGNAGRTVTVQLGGCVRCG